MKNILEFLSQNYNLVYAYGILLLTGIAQVIAFLKVIKKEPVSKEKNIPERLDSIDALRLAIDENDELKAQELFTHLYKFNTSFEKIKLVMSLQDPYSAIRWLKTVDLDIKVDGGVFVYKRSRKYLKLMMKLNCILYFAFNSPIILLFATLGAMPTLIVHMHWKSLYYTLAFSALSTFFLFTYSYFSRIYSLLEQKSSVQQKTKSNESVLKKTFHTFVDDLKKLF